MDAGQLRREGGVFGEEVLEGVAVLEQDAVGVVFGGVWLNLAWGGGWFGFRRIGRVVFLVLLVAGDRATAKLKSALAKWRWYKGKGSTYYGIEHRGHLYFPGCAPHTPQIFGSSFFGEGDGDSASEAGFRSAARSVAGGAVSSGEDAPSIVDCRAGLLLFAAGITLMLLFPSWPKLMTICFVKIGSQARRFDDETRRCTDCDVGG